MLAEGNREFLLNFAVMPSHGVQGETMDQIHANGDGMDTFLFTSESVGEGHPGKKSSVPLHAVSGAISCLCSLNRM